MVDFTKSNKEGYSHGCSTGGISVSFKRNINESGAILVEGGGGSIIYRLRALVIWDPHTDRRETIALAMPSSHVSFGAEVVYHGVFPGVLVKYDVSVGGLRESIEADGTSVPPLPLASFEDGAMLAVEAEVSTSSPPIGDRRGPVLVNGLAFHPAPLGQFMAFLQDDASWAVLHGVPAADPGPFLISSIIISYQPIQRS